jgi:predicted RNase H-like HicB family nuclease/DNA-binding XRE family transcriptional regulator
MGGYRVCIEKGSHNYSAYLPALPGCIATGRTLEEMKHRIREAVAFHIKGLKEEGLSAPKPQATWRYVLEKVERPGPEELKAFRQRHGLTQEQAAALFRVPWNTWARWETGRPHVPPPVVRLLEILDGRDPEFGPRKRKKKSAA